MASRVEETSVGESRDRVMRYYCNCERVRCDGVVRLRLMPDEMLQGSCIKCELVRVLNSKRQQARVAPREPRMEICNFMLWGKNFRLKFRNVTRGACVRVLNENNKL